MPNQRLWGVWYHHHFSLSQLQQLAHEHATFVTQLAEGKGQMASA